MDAQQITQDNQRVVRTSMERQANADSAALEQEFNTNSANMAAERDQAMQTYELENANDCKQRMLVLLTIYV